MLPTPVYHATCRVSSWPSISAALHRPTLLPYHLQGQQRAALAVYLQPFTAIAEQLISHLRNCDDAVRGDDQRG